MEEKELKNVKLLAAKVRRDVLSMLQHRGYGHVGGSLSLVEAYAVLYGKQLRYDASNPHWDERDRVVLSKGHAGPVMYSTLAECGFFPKEWLKPVGCSHLRLYFTVTNPFVFTNYKGFDPEWASVSLKKDGPSTVTYQLGASVKF